MSLRQTNGYLRELYLEYYNNYLTIEKFADHNQMEIEDMRKILALGKRLHKEHVDLLTGKVKTKQETK
jgi:hypothetical protein